MAEFIGTRKRNLAAQENVSEKKWRKRKMPSLTHSLQPFSPKGFCLMLRENMMDRLAQAANILPVYGFLMS